MTTYVNSTIVQSIPLPHQLKRYYVSKFNVLVENNGEQFAADAFSDLFEFCKFYLSKRKLSEPKMEFNNRVPWLPWNNRSRQLLRLLSAQPEYVLNFLKLYTALGEVGTEEQFLRDHKSEMDEIGYRSDIPKFLIRFLQSLNAFGDTVREPYKVSRTHGDLIPKNPKLHNLYKRQVSEGDRLATNHTYNQWFWYWLRCWHMFRPFSSHEVIHANEEGMSKIPTPELYSDVKNVPHGERLQRDPVTSSPTSKKFDQDTADIAACLNGKMEGVGPDYVRAVLQQHMDVTDLLRVSYKEHAPAGRVEAVRKVGTTSYRAIADTNKWLNFVTRPLRNAMYNRMVAHGIHDATQDQDRFNTVIVERVTNPNLYIGSVDLHHATDYLPTAWGQFLLQYMLGYSEFNSHNTPIYSNDPQKRNPAILLGNSFVVFQELIHTPFRSSAGDILWHRGQPLGSEPSFMMLSWTHHFFVEALAWDMGYSHNPYYILGDDIVITNRKLRRRYIQVLRSNAVPLSIQKSYDGNLVEFAGKIFVRNHRPFYTTDHRPFVGYNALFDWSRSTHIALRWRNLPQPLKQRFSSTYNTLGGVDLELSADSAFDLISEIIAEDPTYLNGVMDYISRFAQFVEADPDSRIENATFGHPASGIVSFRGQPITLMSAKYANKDGHWQRYNPVKVKPWFIKKFRPLTTDALIKAGIRAIASH